MIAFWTAITWALCRRIPAVDYCVSLVGPDGAAVGVVAAASAAPDVVEPEPTVSPWVRWGGPAVLATALVLYIVVYMWWPSVLTQVDLQVYRFGATRMWHGHDLYSVGLTGNTRVLLFIYPPFAALCFLPLVFIGEPTVQILWLALNCFLICYAIWLMLKSMGLSGARGLWSLAALLVGLVGWLEAFRLSLQLGQINIVILALVVIDLLLPAQRKWAGVAIGLAAGIKLTPALFIIYLAAIGRLRAAVVASATFAVTVGIGFAVLPSDSGYYWLRRNFGDVKRISHSLFTNTTVNGLLHRLHVHGVAGTAVAVVLAAVALLLAVIAYRRGQAVLAIALVGMASAAASPFSWSHHWVWFAPLMVHLGHRAYILRCAYSAWAMWLLCALLGGWFHSVRSNNREAGVLSLQFGGIWNDLFPGIYVYVFVAVLICTAAWLWRSAAASAPKPETTVTPPSFTEAPAAAQSHGAA